MKTLQGIIASIREDEANGLKRRQLNLTRRAALALLKDLSMLPLTKGRWPDDPSALHGASFFGLTLNIVDREELADAI